MDKQSEQHLKHYVDRNATTSATVTRYFCGNCGSPTHLTNSLHSDSVIVTNGTIDGGNTGVNAEEWRPLKEWHCEEKAAWVPEIEGSEMVMGM